MTTLCNDATIDYYTSSTNAVRGVDERDRWFRVGAALHSLGWGDKGFAIWDEWARQSDKYDEEVQRKTLQSYDRGYSGETIMMGSLIQMARQNGWDEPTMPNEMTLAQPTEAAFDDSLARAVRTEIEHTWGFDPGKDNVYEALAHLCECNRFNLLVDWLDGLKWDRTPRLGKPDSPSWLTTYLNADDTELNRAVGRKFLIAAVRRARRPGTNFEFVLTLESPEGAGKTSAVRILASGNPEIRANFNDAGILHLDQNKQVEAMRGVWFYELSELADLKRADSEDIKAFLSRTTDKVRPAYARKVIELPRTCVFIATTNKGKDMPQLRGGTGNRRWWCVEVGRLDEEALIRDRDQLFAEAAYYEQQGETLRLDPNLWAAAREEQEKREAYDPWQDELAKVTGTPFEKPDGSKWERITTSEVMTRGLLLGTKEMTNAASQRVHYL